MSDDQSEMNDSQAKRAIQKLQKCIVKALEDIKAVDIRVFNTESLSPLFERVIIASGNSNRQTKALAASVRDQLKEEGFPKPRSEGEENGEWIIVDCGAAVVHIMQPAIRQYYHLEDIWGEKPIRLRSTDKPVAKAASKATGKSVGKVNAGSPGGKAKGSAQLASKPARKTSKSSAPRKTNSAPPSATVRSAGSASSAKSRASAKTKPSGTKTAAKPTSKSSARSPLKRK
jgi:ribosome-associated protein